MSDVEIMIKNMYCAQLQVRKLGLCDMDFFIDLSRAPLCRYILISVTLESNYLFTDGKKESSELIHVIGKYW